MNTKNSNFSSTAVEISPAEAELTPHTNRGVILPNFSNKNLGKTYALCAWDWIEWTGKKTEAFLPKKTKNFEIRTKPNGTWHDIDISVNGKWERCAVLCSDMGPAIDKSWCMCKLDNKFCWQGNMDILQLVYDINFELGIVFKNYCRLDVCADFQSTDYRSFTPQMFIDKVAKKDYTFKGKKYKTFDEDGKPIIENTDGKTEIYGRKQIETLRVGSRKSGVSINLYNKTKEMKAKGGKPWIIDAWKQVGFNDQCDTFRAEFSYGKDASCFVSVEKQTGEVTEILQHEDIDIILKLDELFKTLWTKHFDVRIYDKDVRFSRRKPVKILDIERTVFIKTRLSEKQKSTNYTKSNLRNTIKYVKDYLGSDVSSDKVHASEVLRYVQNMCDNHGLVEWFAFNFPEINFEKQVYNSGYWMNSDEYDLFRWRGERLDEN